MSHALIPISIFGLPFVGLLVLSAIYKGGTSDCLRPTVGATGNSSPDDNTHSAELGLISQLSGPVSPGAIRRLSGPVAPGAIATLSRRVSPGAIAKLSGHVSPGAISRLSRPKSPGAVASLSAPRPVGAIANLSAGFFVSNLLRLPLLTRSQAPLEPDNSLLISESSSDRSGARPQPPTEQTGDRSRPKAGPYGIGG